MPHPPTKVHIFWLSQLGQLVDGGSLGVGCGGGVILPKVNLAAAAGEICPAALALASVCISILLSVLFLRIALNACPCPTASSYSSMGQTRGKRRHLLRPCWIGRPAHSCVGEGRDSQRSHFLCFHVCLHGILICKLVWFPPVRRYASVLGG